MVLLMISKVWLYMVEIFRGDSSLLRNALTKRSNGFLRITNFQYDVIFLRRSLSDKDRFNSEDTAIPYCIKTSKINFLLLHNINFTW